MKATAKMEVVFIPSAVRPGTRFPGFTSREIRLRNCQGWYAERRERRQKAFSEAQAARAGQEQPKLKPVSYGSMAQAFDAALMGGNGRQVAA